MRQAGRVMGLSLKWPLFFRCAARPAKLQPSGDNRATRVTLDRLGCVFTQTTCDKKGFAIRDPDSTTYTGAIESASEFGKRIYREAWKRGWSRAKKKVVIGDGPNG
jgi:hypothetical protein